MSFPRYPAYQDSKLEWAKTLPEHWAAKHLKRNVRLLTEKTDTRECPVGLENLEGWTGRFIQTESDFQGEGVGFEADDILFGKLRPYLAKVWLADRRGEAIGDFHVLRPSECVIPRFIQYQLLTREVVDLVDGSTYGAKMPRASWGFLGCLELPTPPAEEQLAITNFLDRETAKIDTLISEQKRLVEIFKLKLSSLALSGFQDEEPNYQRIGRVTRIISRPVDIKVDEEYEPLGLFNRGRGIFHKESRRGADMGDSDFFYVEAGDLVLSGQFAWEGSVAVADKSESGCVVSHRYPIIQGDNENCLTEFLIALLWTEHGDFVLNQCSRGAAGRNRPLNLGLLLKEEIALPCLTIQRAIQEEYRKYVGLKNEQAKQTGLALERRSALISAAVTGQIDVRGLVKGEGSEQ